MQMSHFLRYYGDQIIITFNYKQLPTQTKLTANLLCTVDFSKLWRNAFVCSVEMCGGQTGGWYPTRAPPTRRRQIKEQRGQ